MATSKALLDGIGSVQHVWAIHAKRLNELHVSDTHIDSLLLALNAVDENAEMQLAAKAIVCAWLNKSFIESGSLFMLDGAGHVDRKIYAPKDDRKLMAELISRPAE